MPSHAVRETRANKLRRFLRPTVAQGVLGIAFCLVAAVGVVQIRSTATVDPYSSMRRADLVQMLAGLNAESGRLDEQINQLKGTRDDLRSGVDSSNVAADQASQRLSQLELLAGTVPAQGPGIRITISAPAGKVTANAMLDNIEELRDAGAEAIEINDSLRVVASTWFADGDNVLIANGQQLSLPLTVDVIGEPHELAEASRFRGGLVSQIESQKVGGSVKIDTPAQVEIDSTATVTTPRWAKPA
ncbi:DUF881 domain-containing protein [Propionibacterium freudenreichii]|uniref:DUF881 domain-containing protein n=1 Tax=Propionibacterium freudenreichii TaxID=1744 RepID=UPI0022FDA21B|nr:DUF881 domain-containing protein [Propionibacterium freudenreichii]